MTRYAAFLRGVSPLNARMPDVKKAFERAGFGDVKTFLSSGNVTFDAKEQDPARLERTIEAALEKHLGTGFMTFVRPVEELRKLLRSDPFSGLAVPPDAKRVITFLRKPPTAAVRRKLGLPVELDGARLHAVRGGEAFTAYVRSPRGPVFMTLIQKTFGKDATTRTWETVARVAK